MTPSVPTPFGELPSQHNRDLAVVPASQSGGDFNVLPKRDWKILQAFPYYMWCATGLGTSRAAVVADRIQEGGDDESRSDQPCYDLGDVSDRVQEHNHRQGDDCVEGAVL